MNIGKKPNFLIVGAAKAGTTSLANYLNEHKDIYIPESKELRYFIADSIKKVNPQDPLLPAILRQSCLEKEEYYKLFDRDEKILGEASVQYLYHYQEAVPKIKKELGDIPIIIMLRDPVKRAFSNWKFVLKDPLSFENALKEEKNRKFKSFNSFWFYKELGFYYDQVKCYLDNFSMVKVIIFEEFIKNPDFYLNDLCDLFSIQKVEFATNIVHNVKDSFIPKYDFMFKNRLFKKIFNPYLKSSIFNKYFYDTKMDSMSKEIFEELKREYNNDKLLLEALLGRKLLLWE